MSSFDLPTIGGFDPSRYQRAALGLTAKPSSIQDPERITIPPGGPQPDGSSAFAGALADAVGHVQALQDDVKAKTRGLALGEDVELHDVMLAASKSEVAFNLLLEVRNKMVEAWEKLSRAGG